MELPRALEELLEDAPMGHIASVNPDGSPHLVPVWVGYDGECFLVSGRRHKRRHANVDVDPRVALSILDLDAPYSRCFLVEGVTEELTADGATEFLHEMSERHLSVETHPIEDTDRLCMRIRPTNVVDSSADFDADAVG